MILEYEAWLVCNTRGESKNIVICKGGPPVKY